MGCLDFSPCTWVRKMETPNGNNNVKQATSCQIRQLLAQGFVVNYF